MVDPLEILRDFVDYGQPGCDNFPIRCFVRFRESGDATKWKSFWERSRDKYQLELEREDSSSWWEEDKVLKKPNPVEKYVVQRLELLNSPSSESSDSSSSKSEDPDSGSESSSSFEPSRYYFTCRPQVIHCHYQSGKIKSIPNPEHEIMVECDYPQNIVYYEGEDTKYPQMSLTCFNPTEVCKIDGKKKIIDPKPDIITFDNISWVKYSERESESCSRPCNNPFTLSKVGSVAEIYLNHLNQSFVDEFVTREKDKNTFPFFVHVKYASLQRNKELESSIDAFNKNPNFRLKFTPFTDSDWRIVNRQIADKFGNGSYPHNLIKYFTDFAQYGHYYRGFKVHCFVSYQQRDSTTWQKDWTEANASHAELNALNSLEKNFSGIVKLYMNASPCTVCAKVLITFATNNTDINVHVKYTGFYKGKLYKSDLNQINDINNDDKLNLRIDPFNVDDDDWKILGRALIDRIQNHTDNDTDNENDELTRKIKDSLKIH